MPDRSSDLQTIIDSLGVDLAHGSERCAVGAGDALELLRRMPPSSVSLILTDPPYHSTKKENIYGDRAFAEDAAYLDWLAQYGREWQRVLRPNGGVYLFCAASLSARIEVLIAECLKPLNHITWTKPNDPGFDGWKGKMRKEALRRWYPHSERILFFEQAAPGHDRRSTLGAFLREARNQAGLSGHQLTEAIGAYGAVNHGGAVSNWETGRNIPNRDQYARMMTAFRQTGRCTDLPEYEDIVRPFHVNGSIAFTDVWDFPGVRPYRGKHPAEKPQALLRHAISASSYPGDIVLDCFSGSGSTAVAALAEERRTVALEIEPAWVERTVAQVKVAEATPTLAKVHSLDQRRLPPHKVQAASLLD